jgi:hypothetical protein
VAIRVVVVVLAAALFGAADLALQRAGGDTAFWLSNMSAFWLMLAFIAGWVMPTVRAAAVIGLIVTQVALTAFYVASRSALPAETWQYIVGGTVTGPVFGVLGRRWGAERWLPGAVVLSAAFCCEPVAWTHYKGFLPPPTYIWNLEAIGGVLLGLAFAAFASRQQAGSDTPSR